jgi:ketosteroid isomerase-like protein
MSRHGILVLALSAAFVGASCTQGTAPGTSAPATIGSEPAATPAPAEDVAAVISQLEHQWVDAIVKKDTAALDRLLAEDFNGTSPTAHLYNKTMAVDDLSRGTYVVESMNLDEVSVNAYGDVAVAFTSQEEKSRYGGKDLSGHYHYTDVWARKDGRWQVVASHGTRFDTQH